MDPCKPEVRPGAREELASPAWLAAPAMNVRFMKVQLSFKLLVEFEIVILADRY